MNGLFRALMAHFSHKTWQRLCLCLKQFYANSVHFTGPSVMAAYTSIGNVGQRSFDYLKSFYLDRFVVRIQHKHYRDFSCYCTMH